ncbi:MAG: hypothetical protein R3F17_02270 [Planctomycetota bacterium]
MAIGLALVRAARVSAISFSNCASAATSPPWRKAVLAAPDNSAEEEERFQEFSSDPSNRPRRRSTGTAG